MASEQGKETPIDPAMVQRVSGASKVSQGLGMILHGFGDFFAPGQPIPQSAGEKEKGRQFDYPVARNIGTQTKDDSTSGVTFPQLRVLADSWDVLRLVIETRKDLVTRLPWSFTPKDEDDKSETTKAQCLDAQRFFERPDKVTAFDGWLRKALEDMFVIDAASWYVRKQKDGKVYGFEPVDGATIRRLVDYQGRTPLPPDPAYQQMLHGLPATFLTSEELLYRPRNVRANKVYGFSHVEQILYTINTALRRQAHVMEFYTEGTVPDALAEVPDDWSVKQIEEAQIYMDALLSGRTGMRRKLRFIPPVKNLHFPKLDAQLKDPVDEWFARIVCYAFGVSPIPFISQVNRSVSDTMERAGSAEGLEPVLFWVENRVNEMALMMGWDKVGFKFQREKEIDILKKAEAEATQIKIGKLSIDEVRAKDGLDPIGVGHAVHTATGLVFIGKDAPAQTIRQPVTEPKPPSVRMPAEVAAPEGQEQPNPKPAIEQPKPEPEPAKAAKGGARAVPPVPFKGPKPYRA